MELEDVDLPLDESDVYYYESRTACDEDGPLHSPAAVKFFLLATGHLRLGQLDQAQRHLLFAHHLDQVAGNKYFDAQLLLVGLGAGEAKDLQADYELLEGPEVNRFLWLLGVPLATRKLLWGAWDDSKAKKIVSAIRVAPELEAAAKALLKVARSNVGLG